MSSIVEQQQQQQQQQQHEGPELQNAIRRQVEYYLSRQNLQSDVFLVSQMDDQQSVPVSLLTSFKMLRQLTTDVDLVCASVQDSDLVTVVHTAEGPRIRPVNIQQTTRNTVILRDISKETDEKIVMALFSVDNVPQSLRPEIGSTWWATFATEQGAVSALEHLRTQQLQDRPIRAYIKAETLLKSDTRTMSATAAEFVPAAAAAQNLHSNNNGNNISGNYYYPNYAWDPYNGHAVPMDYHASGSSFRGGRGGGYRSGRRGGSRGGFSTINGDHHNGSTSKQRRQQNGFVDNSLSASDSTSQQRLLSPPTSKGGKQRRDHGQQRPNEGSSEKSSSKTKAARSDNDSAASRNYHENSASSKIRAANKNNNRNVRSNARQQNLPSFSSVSFPPLPRVSPAKASGYDGEFIKYDKQSIINLHNTIISSSTSTEFPEPMAQDVAGIVSDPNVQLELTKPPLSDNTVISPTGPKQREVMEAMFDAATVKKASEAAPAESTLPNAKTSTTINGTSTNKTSSSAAVAAAATAASKSFVEVALHAKDIQPPRKSSFSVSKKARSRAASRIDDSMKPSAELLAKARSKLAATDDQRSKAEVTKNPSKKGNDQKEKVTNPQKQISTKDDEMKVVVKRKRYAGRQKDSGKKEHKERNNHKNTTGRRRKDSNVNDGVAASEIAQLPRSTADENSYASIASKIKSAAKANQKHEVQQQQQQQQQQKQEQEQK